MIALFRFHGEDLVLQFLFWTTLAAVTSGAVLAGIIQVTYWLRQKQPPAGKGTLGALIGGLATGPLMTGCVWVTAGGHGTYIPAIGLFPFGMLVAGLQSHITAFAVGLAIVQFPAYGLMIGLRPRKQMLLILATTQIATAIAAAVAGRNQFF